ncbi:VWA domain-containing protein [Pseudomonas sp. NFXW11]|uniref:vWA domain-containing protein n=1 Tax=Pseudomonas sp. NFXW11 TaxID=2819531 RepID=UPI003CEC07E3
MGRNAGPGTAHGRPSRSAELAKKALGIRPRTDRGADAKPRAGQLEQGRHGASRLAREGRIHWPGTLLKGRPRQHDDLLFQLRRRAPHELWLVLVDASASTRRQGALSAAKGVLAQLFDDAYRQRARLALLTASGRAPSWQVQGLKASKDLGHWLDGLAAGGGTPLLQALDEAGHWLEQRQRRLPAEQRRVLLITDGRLKSLPALAPLNCPTLLLDIERGPIRLGRARELAQMLDAEYRHIDSPSP